MLGPRVVLRSHKFLDVEVAMDLEGRPAILAEPGDRVDGLVNDALPYVDDEVS